MVLLTLNGLFCFVNQCVSISFLTAGAVIPLEEGGVRHCHAQPSPDTWRAPARRGLGGGSARCWPQSPQDLAGMRVSRGAGSQHSHSPSIPGTSGPPPQPAEETAARPDPPSLPLTTSKSSRFSRSSCQAAAPIFELTFPGFNPLSLWPPPGASRKQ